MSNAVVDHVINNRVSPPTDTPIGASAENVTYSEETTYSSGSVGSAITDLKENLTQGTYFRVPTTVSDLNSAIEGHSTRYATNSTNAPDTLEGNVITFGNGRDNQVQIAVTSAKKIYYRRLWGSTWASWTRLDNQYDPVSGVIATDLNDIDPFKAYRFSNNTSNKPNAYEGMVFTFKSDSQTAFQIAVGGNQIFFRRYWNGWQSWDTPYASTGQKITDDLNNATSACLTYRYANNALHAPTNNEGDVAVFIGGSDNIFQIAVNSVGNMFVRHKWGSDWSDWKSYQEAYSLDYPFTVSPANLSTIPSIGIIGDSYASGEIRLNDSWHDIYDQSWGQIIARNKGINVYNYSHGGQSAIGFVSDSNRGLPQLLTDTKKNLYVIVLGINDDKTVEGIGTSADIGTDANTFYGAYSKIIAQILNYSPHSKIIVCKTANNSSEGYQRINTAMQTIADYYEVPTIAQYEHPFFTSSYYTGTMVSGHPNPSSYGGMANALTEMIEKCMADEWEYFYDVNYYNL